jgi:hypothetical protein
MPAGFVDLDRQTPMFLHPQKPSDRDVKPPTAPLAAQKPGPVLSKSGPNRIFVRHLHQQSHFSGFTLCYASARPKWRQPFAKEPGGRSPTGS